MFSIILKIKRRIKKILKVKSESRQQPPSSVHSRTRKIVLLFMASLLVGVLYPGENLYDPLDMPRRGDISLEDVIAPFQITIYKSDRELSEEMEVIRLSMPYLLDYDTTVVQLANRRLDELFNLIDSLRTRGRSSDQMDQERFVTLISGRFPMLSRDAILRSFGDVDLAASRSALKRVYAEEIFKVGVLLDMTGLEDAPGKNILIRRGDRESIHPREQLLTAPQANVRLLGALNRVAARDTIDVEYCYLIGRTFITPNLIVNRTEYQRRLDADLASVSNVKETVEQGDIIVRSGARVTAKQQRILEELSRIKRAEAAERGLFTAFIPVLARVLLVLAAFSALYVFLYYFRREIFHSNPKLLTMFLVFALQLFMVQLVDRWDVTLYLYPVAVLPIMITILFDAEVGILSTIVLALLLGMMHRFNFTVGLLTMVVGTVACLTSRRVRRRSDFFKIMLALSATYAVFIFLVENLKFTANPDVLTEVGFGLVNATVAVLLTIGILPIFESLFGITTNITLLELSDMNHPLLKRLAVEAPGTYQHSIVVGNLSEAAAEAIGGNSLLARVGAYYHDIGKIEVPEYFVENQLSVKSKHDELPPSMSSLILTSHVKRGRQLGEDAEIPDDVLNFIEEHHGTMVMSYFYNRALEQGGDESDMDKYRYPGPKPQIRETAIAMLADAVEAASRTLDDPKPARIQNLIQRIINDRFQSGELDECPLTLRDLAKIREAFAQILIAAFHHRVVYPKKEEDEGK